jgi:hypothetical protein
MPRRNPRKPRDIQVGGDVAPTIQQIVDNLGEWLGRPVILEDGFLRLIAYSSHDCPVDPVRRQSILRRQATAEVGRWLEAFGLRHARHPVRVPGNPDLHMLPRVCVPVLHKGVMLGHLWFIDADETMTSAQIAYCVGEASVLATLLYRDHVADRISSARVSDAMELLLTGSPSAAEAARGLEEDGYIDAPEGIVAVVVASVRSSDRGPAGTEDALGEALSDCRRVLRPSETVQLVRRDHCVMLLAAPADSDPVLRARVHAVLASARDRVAVYAPHVSIVVGVGCHRSQLEQAAGSYREARMAADAAAALPGIGAVAFWGQLGVDQVVVRLAGMGEPPVVHPGLHRLLGDPDALLLAETVETYLDVAGNAQLAAERLNLHRTSLYYRLQRIEQLAGTDLKNGLERLALHLELKVARLTGRYVPRHPVDRLPDRSTAMPEPPAPLPANRLMRRSVA